MTLELLGLPDFPYSRPIIQETLFCLVEPATDDIYLGVIHFLQDTGGMTCFHLATRLGHTDLIKLLLKTGKFGIDQKVC